MTRIFFTPGGMNTSFPGALPNPWTAFPGGAIEKNGSIPMSLSKSLLANGDVFLCLFSDMIDDDSSRIVNMNVI